jgi:hypothetical protein
VRSYGPQPLFQRDHHKTDRNFSGIIITEEIVGGGLDLGYPIGRFALMDLTSNDLNLKVGKILYEAYGERFQPRPALVKKVDGGSFWPVKVDYGKK